MMSDRATGFFRYLSYAMEITVAFILGNTPGLLPELFGAKPTLLLCAALTIALYEREIPAMIIGAICGSLIDLGYSNSIGFFAISLTVICFVVGYAANNLIVANFPNFIIYSVIAIGGLFTLYFMINFVWAGIADSWVYYTDHIISRMAQTFIYSILFYFLNKLIHRLLGQEV